MDLVSYTPRELENDLLSFQVNSILVLVSTLLERLTVSLSSELFLDPNTWTTNLSAINVIFDDAERERVLRSDPSPRSLVFEYVAPSDDDTRGPKARLNELLQVSVRRSLLVRALFSKLEV